MNVPAQKEYSVSWEAKGDHLFARAGGVRTIEAVMALTMEVFDAAQDAHLSKALVDVRDLEGRLSVLDSYRLVTEVFEKLRGKGMRKVAVVDVQQSLLREWFLDVVARNRGFNFRVFAGQDEALEWLGS